LCFDLDSSLKKLRAINVSLEPLERFVVYQDHLIRPPGVILSTIRESRRINFSKA
jgi:hypothetical protein